jgi:hypothetical protein
VGTPTPDLQQRIIYQVSMYSSLVDMQTGPNLEAQLYAAIQKAFEENVDEIGQWEVAWGPVVVQHNTTEYAINAMYLAESKGEPGTYVLGIAGTNPSSLFDWVVEDALVSVQVPWIYGLISAPDAKIALGTAIGLAILQNAAPGSGIPGTGTTVLEFLRDIPHKQGMKLVVSGHSLGGALSPTLALWLHDVRILWDLLGEVALSTMPTAGPTAGNSAFAAYSDSKLSITRFANAIDVVPHAWQASDLAEIPTLYVPYIEPDDAINDLVALAERISKNGDYTQLVGDTGWFPFDVQQNLISEFLPAVVNFIIQLAWQHTKAYVEYFAIKTPELNAWADHFVAVATEQAPALAALSAAAPRQATAPVAGRPTVIPPASDPQSRVVAAKVLAELSKAATPDQQQLVMPVDPSKLVDARAGVGGS